MQVAEVVAQVLLQAQTDVLIEVAADPGAPPQSVDGQIAQAGTSFCLTCRPHLDWLLLLPAVMLHLLQCSLDMNLVMIH